MLNTNNYCDFEKDKERLKRKNQREKEYGVALGQFKVLEGNSGGLYNVVSLEMRSTIAIFQMPVDFQLLQDMTTLENIVKIIKDRWCGMHNIKSEESKPRNNYYDIYFQQINFNQYEFYLYDGMIIGKVTCPADFNYHADMILIKDICKQLSSRYELE